MESFEFTLVNQAQKGDLAAFNKLISLHDKRIYQLAIGILGNADDAADVYQETFLKAFTKIGSYNFEGAFIGWLSRIAVNLSINARKKRNRRKLFSLGGSSDNYTEMDWQLKDKNPDPERGFLSMEIEQSLKESLDGLPPQQRAIFIMKHSQGMKISEIADSLNCAEGTVKNQLFRAVQKLKKQMKELYEPKI